jgi:hypothetical protein
MGRVARGIALSLLLVVMVPALSAQPFLGQIELPLENELAYGMVLVRGFALDNQPVSRIDLYVDDVFQHSANLNIPRIDISQSYPDYNGIHTRAPGFQTGFLASRFSNGPHTIHAVVTTADNRKFEIGRRTINIDNTINQPPFGAIDIPDQSGIFDANGSFPVVGWVNDTDGVARVDVQVDNLNMQSAIYGDPRPDVANAFPDLPSAQFSGFVAHIDTTRIQDGVHTLVVRATDRAGLSRVIGRRNIQVFNSTNNLRPFGFLDEPRRDSVLYGTNCGVVPPCQVSPCAPVNTSNHITPVRGWALDLGTRQDTGRVSYAELLVDGVRWYSTDQCSYSTEFGGYINCYGLPRFDVSKYYPTYPDAPRAGFLFTMDVGALIALGVRPGHHVLKVRVGDQEQTFADIPNTSGIPVFFACAPESQDFPSFGFIDSPRDLAYVKGEITFFGWALDEDSSVRDVEVIVDGLTVGLAQYGLTRTDVQVAYPFIRDSDRSGWRFTLDTTKLSDARHRVTVRVRDGRGRVTEIGSSDFYVDNPN